MTELTLSGTSGDPMFVVFLSAVMLAGVYLIHAHRRLLARTAALAKKCDELAGTLVATQESTLRHVSRELHDEFGQVFTAVGCMISHLQNKTGSNPALQTELAEIRELAQSALEKIRRLSQALQPPMLEEVGLANTLAWYLPQLQKQTGIAIQLIVTGAPFQLENAVNTHVYRVIQESLNNVARHSGSSQAWVCLNYQPRTLQVSIEDNGKGLPRTLRHRGIGLVSMVERAKLMHGSVEFLPRPEGGTLVHLTIPMRDRN